MKILELIIIKKIDIFMICNISNYHIKMEHQEKFIEIYNQNQGNGNESYVDIVSINGIVYKRFFSSIKFNNTHEIDQFFDQIVINENFQMIKQSGNCVIFEEMKTGDTKYYVYRNELFVEKVVLQEIERIGKSEINQKLSISLK